MVEIPRGGFDNGHQVSRLDETRPAAAAALEEVEERAEPAAGAEEAVLSAESGAEVVRGEIPCGAGAEESAQGVRGVGEDFGVWE